MSKKKIDPRIREYTKRGEKKYKFQLYVGTDPLTGKEKRTTRSGFDTAIAAERALKRLEVEIASNGAQVIQKTQKKRYSEVYEAWFANYKRTVKESTWSSTKFIFNKHILPAFGDNYIDKIDVLFCQKIVNEWSETAPKIFKKYKNYTSNVFDYAMTLQLITNNPMNIVTMPRGELLVKEDKVIPYYTKNELIEFLNAAKAHNQMYRTFFSLLAFTGLRKGEALALEWSDIDFKKKTLDVNKTLSRGDNNTVIINRPKTKKGIRNILIDDNLIAILKQHRKRSGNLLQLHSNDLIFNKAGEPYKSVSTKTWLLSIYRANPDLKQISAHGFRHTHASLMFEAGAEIKDVQERLGHADIQTTSNIYTHVTESRNEKVMEKFISFMSSI